MVKDHLMGGKPLDLEKFDHIQERLSVLLNHEGARATSTVVVVPSLTLHPDELQKIPGAVYFEERLLFKLQMLRQPQIRIVYVTSQKIDPVIVDYTIDLVASTSKLSARRRLTLLDCNDESLNPLTAKILRRSELIEAIQSSITDITHAYLVTYNSSPLERELALRLGIPLFSCDPELVHLGTKSNGRRLLREAGVPVPDGFEDLRHESDLVNALAELKFANPHLTRAMVKLNDSFAGVGNVTFSYADAPAIDNIAPWIATELPKQLNLPGQGDNWPSYSSKFRAMGGVVECYIDAPSKRSPSAQLEISPQGDVQMLSTHDQVLGGATGQTFVGCTFPAREPYRCRIQKLALRVGRILAAKGVIGQLSIDFLVDNSEQGERIHALEINLRMGGATAPYMFLHGLVEGRYACESGDYLTPEGQPRYYVTSDRIQCNSFRALVPQDVINFAIRHRLHYSRETRTGAIFYAFGALSAFGRLGVVAIGSSPDEAQRIYDTLVTTLDAKNSRYQTQPSGS